MPTRGLALISILLFATLLRLYRLDFRALWWDEGLSLLFARLDYFANAQMAVKLADTNPPVYRLLLGLWITLVGSSAFTARLFSGLPGLVLVALTYRLARALRLSTQTAVIAAALCAASPMLIYYSQEAKGYSLVAMASTASALVWTRLTRAPIPAPRRPRSLALWALYAFTLLLAVGSHYIAAFRLAVENLWTLRLTIHSWRGHEKHRLTHWAGMLGAQAAVALALLPFAIATFGGTSAAVRGETGEFQNLGAIEFITRHVVELTQGPTAEGGWVWGGAGVVIGLLVIGYWRLNDRQPDDGVGLGGFWGLRFTKVILLSWILIPLAFGFALNAYHEFFFPRFVLYVVPAIMILVAEGILRVGMAVLIPIALFARSMQAAVNKWQYWVLASLGLVIMLLWSPTLLNHYNTPTEQRDDWRPIAAALRPLAREGDAAIYVWGWIPGYLDAYLPPAPQPDYALGYFTPESLDADMRALIAGRERAWLLDHDVDQFDLRNLAGNWLRPRAALVYDDWPGGGAGHVALFVLKQTPTTSPNLLTFEFANGLRLTLPELQTTLTPGDALALNLVWSPTRPLADHYTIFLHAQAEDGALIAGRDSEPNNGSAFVTDWKVGERYTELRGVLIPPDTPPGRYVLSIGLYKTATGEVDQAGPKGVGAVVVK